MMVPVRREQEEASFEEMKRSTAAVVRSLVSVLERPGVSIGAIRLAERRASEALSELRMVAASLSNTHT